MDIKMLGALLSVLLLVYLVINGLKELKILPEQNTKLERQSMSQNNQENEWDLNTSFGFPFRIALNSVQPAPAGDHRTLLLLIEAQDFTEDNLKKVFAGLAADFAKPKTLFITAYSDEEMLKRAIKLYGQLPMEFDDTPESEEWYREWAEKNLPSKTGYYRAKYHRIPLNYYYHVYTDEKFSYSPDPEKEDVVTIILQDKSDSPYTENVNTDLIIAAMEGDTDKVKSLLAQGANVNAKDENGYTALISASLYGDEQTVKILLAHGADVNAKNGEGSTALKYAATVGETEIVKDLLAKGADVNAGDEHNHTALIGAASNGHADTVKVLLANGAEINAKGHLGATALINAALHGHGEVVKILLSHGADVNLKDNKGRTALMSAQEHGYNNIIKLLKRAGARE